MAKQVSPRSKSEVPMDVASSHSSGTGPIVHYELPTADALEAKLVVERDSASALRDEVDMLRKQTAQSQAVLKTTIKYWANSSCATFFMRIGRSATLLE